MTEPGLPDKIANLLDSLERQYIRWPATFSACTNKGKDELGTHVPARGGGRCKSCLQKELLNLGISISKIESFTHSIERANSAYMKMVQKGRDMEQGN